MGLKPIWDPGAEPLDRVVKLRFSRRQLKDLDLAVREFGMSRSWLLREAVALGFPLLVESVRQRRRAGFVTRGEYVNPGASGPRRGPRMDGPRPDRWVYREGGSSEGDPFPDTEYREEGGGGGGT